MKKLLLAAALCWVVPGFFVQGQIAPVTTVLADISDPIGQRFGWTADQIAASVRAEKVCTYEYYRKAPAGEEGVLLVFNTPVGMRLRYFLDNAGHAQLAIPYCAHRRWTS